MDPSVDYVPTMNMMKMPLFHGKLLDYQKGITRFVLLKFHKYPIFPFHKYPIVQEGHLEE